MSIDPADWLAAFATMTLPPQGPRGEALLVPAAQVVVPAGFGRRIVAAFLDVALVITLGGFLALMITMLVWGPLFGDGDFDGPEQLDVLFDWTIIATWTGLALAYVACELSGRPSVGKFLVGLRIVVPGGPTRRRLVLRWALSYAPLLILFVLFTAGAVYTYAVGWQGFDDHGWRPGIGLRYFAGALAILWIVCFLGAARPPLRTPAEQFSGTELARPGPRPAKQRRGFEVIPTAGVSHAIHDHA